MAAIFTYSGSSDDIFRVRKILPNVSIGFLESLMSNRNTVIVSEVVLQNRDTIQYFLTFDDLITYFYYGKGLGSITISGSILVDIDKTNSGSWTSLEQFMAILGKKRGSVIGDTTTDKSNTLIIGKTAFKGVISSFTIRASADVNLLNCVEFVIQVDVIDSLLEGPKFKSAC